MTLYAIILAGGSGTRFWPKSRSNFPKQFLVLRETDSLLQATVRRITPLIPPARIWVVTAAHLQAQTRAQLPELPPAQILSEPAGRNTAAAIGLAACRLQAIDPEAIMAVLPADHTIADGAAFRSSLQQAATVVRQHDVLMTLGIQPTYPAIGYGYIQVGDPLATPAMIPARHAAQFIEKPSAETAADCIASAQYLWNSGIFVWRVATIREEIMTHLPDLWQGLQTYLQVIASGGSAELGARHYAQLPMIPIDKGVLERSSRVAVLPVTFDWHDVGSWRALVDLHPQDHQGNVVVGHHRGQDSTGLVVYSPERLVATIDVHDVIIVCTDDVVLICAKDRDQDVRKLVDLLRQQGRTEYL